MCAKKLSIFGYPVQIRISLGLISKAFAAGKVHLNEKAAAIIAEKIWIGALNAYGALTVNTVP